uniref:Putative conserved plasma membrane protein n=1 Tax=Xenopsylla cheopis TaxID=163159 RepID=A0A6M2DDT3_XENCH
MSLSKPIYNFLGWYFEQLFNYPLATKSLSSCVIASSGNLASQLVAGNKNVSLESIGAFGLFGLLFGGPVPHYFYKTLEELMPANGSNGRIITKFLIERLLYTPFYQVLSLYTLARFEGKSHSLAYNQLMHLFWPVLQANWRYLSLLVFINIKFVPPMLRVLVVNLIGFFWAMYLANKRRQQNESKKTYGKKRN